MATTAQAGKATAARRKGVAIAKAARRPAALNPKAFEPDARARAILRGRLYAEQDLAAAGGTYSVDEVRGLLNDISRQALDKKIADGSLLAVPGPSGRRRFPTLQFNDYGTLVPGLKAVQAALAFSSPWSVLNFLVNGQEALEGLRPIDLLRAGEVERVVEAATRVGVQGA